MVLKSIWVYCYLTIITQQDFKDLFNFYALHTYHSRFIPEGVAEASQIFFRNAHVLTKILIAMRNTADVTGGKPIAVYLRRKIY
jgi:hypothetical protein